MDKLIKFLKSFGLTDQEIQKVFKDLPVNPEGFAGTNVAKGIFEKGGKKSSAQNPLIAETMISPFKLDKYKGLSKEQTLKKVEEAINFLDKELTKTSNLLVNENLQLSPEQKINFANNLRMKREFEKELEIFKTKPETPVIELKTKEPVIGKGLESLIEEAGQTSRPGTLMGDIESRINRLKNLTKEEGTTIQDVVGDFASGQKGMLKLRDEGLVRSTARQIMFNDIKFGKLKASKEVQDIVLGKASGDPIDSFRTIYGEDALEQLDSLTPDLRQLKTEVDAEKLARSKFEFTPKLDRPKESYTPEEMEKILKEGEGEGTKGLDYLTGKEPPEKKAVGGRVGFSNGTEDAPSITLDSHDKAPANMDKYPIKAGNLELGIMGAMSSGKSTPNTYVKVNTADRNFTVRGKYNVPDTGVSLLGDIGDLRMRNTQNINVPQYDYKETIKDVMRANPYSVGIEYAPDQNKNINLRYDDRGNVTLRGEARFAKGGLGYLMGE